VVNDSPIVPRIIADANVLFPATLRDTLFRAQEEGLVEVRLSMQIWEEVRRNLLSTGRMSAAQIAHIERETLPFFGRDGMLVENYEFLVPTLTNDPKDRHVLAAAIQGHAATIVTVNLKDFPPASLTPFGIRAEHPDAFLVRLTTMYSTELADLLRAQAADKVRPPQTVEQLLAALTVHVPRFVALMRAVIQSSGEDDMEVEPPAGPR